MGSEMSEKQTKKKKRNHTFDIFMGGFSRYYGAVFILISVTVLLLRK
jgi:hypothetical protein